MNKKDNDLIIESTYSALGLFMATFASITSETVEVVVENYKKTLKQLDMANKEKHKDELVIVEKFLDAVKQMAYDYDELIEKHRNCAVDNVIPFNKNLN